MLKELYIENIAVIEESRIEFSEGFNVLTGETGAGKSILIGSLGAILGERITREMVRAGAEKASVTAVFTDVRKEVREKLSEDGFFLEEGEELIVTREIGVDGRSSCRILGKPCTVTALRALGDELIKIHGQHDNRDLFSLKEHIGYVDTYGGHEELIAEYGATFGRFCEVRDRLLSVQTDETEKERKIDLLTYQIEELERADLSEEEEQTLEEDRVMIRNSIAIVEGFQIAHAEFFGVDEGDIELPGAVEKFDRAVESLEEISAFYPAIESVAERARGLFYEIEEVAEEVSGEMDDLEFQPGRLDEIEGRLDEIYKLKRKYGGEISDLEENLIEWKKELEMLETSDKLIEELLKEKGVLFENASALAQTLRERRANAAKQFVEEVHTELEDLNMPGVTLTFRMEETELSELGADKLYFLISANPGEPPKPVSKIASGGELSRLMLAIKKVLAERDTFDTQIFDEIDTGVSGTAAEKIGRKLWSISRGRQIICVTHLAQIAVLADQHLLIFKEVEGGRTATEVIPLSFDGQVQEIARIIGGESVTPLTLENAKEMILLAKKKK